ncbi:MAG TPA: potassium transporter Kup [Lentisphaeria bacterium]|nr:MAG: potassium transporter Kup [Lentisphaerae bacterium GWF2_49_21]HBC85959.1 potassium transporter Kup [Lentisphaeria bacterium]
MDQTANTTGTNYAKDSLYVLILGALGVVYGDIGTSPLYAFRECFSESYGLQVCEANILGILSLFFWSLTLTISLKYLTFLLKADNNGEGGILALMALVVREMQDTKSKKKLYAITMLGIIGAALLYGDGIITPSISVLSAVEGLNVATKVFEPYIIYISIAILAVLFAVQRIGTSKIGAVFGPIIFLWFITIAAVGLMSIFNAPEVLYALNPVHAFEIFTRNQWHGFAVLGSVFLAVTGGEVLYADMGHFGKSPMRIGWFTLVLPALLLNYFGQGAYLLRRPNEVENLFYRLSPEFLHYPMVVLATLATIIASQAVISGAFSLGRQALQLGFFPRMRIIHTSSKEIGQVFMPAMNIALFTGTVVLILGFKNSGSLAGAYGIAVSGTMLITTVLAIIIARKVWPTRTYIMVSVAVLFLVIDASFFMACSMKIRAGGWLPVLIAALIYFMISTWMRYRSELGCKVEATSLPVGLFLKDLEMNKPFRPKGTAVFLTGNPTGIPRTLLHNFKHNQVVHEQVILMTVKTEDIPFVPDDRRTEVMELGGGMHRVLVKYGFSEDPNIPEALHDIREKGFKLDLNKITYILGRESLVIKPDSIFRRWRKKIFSFMSKNSYDASTFYGLPPGKVIEYGLQVEL